MPIYVYQCPEEHTHTCIESMGDAPDTSDCPRCGRIARRIMATPQRPIVKGGTKTFHRRDD